MKTASRVGWLMGISLIGGLSTATAVHGEEDLQQRLTALEARVNALQESAESPSPLAVHGYGEIHYNNLAGEGGASDKEEIDFHRFVLFFGYDFTERIRFRSELEVEHAVTGGDEPGEVELEQAYIDFDLNDRHAVRAGLFLIPVGLLNEQHEPPRFYGVERNPVENRILPTTWVEGGVGLHGQLATSFRYDAYLHSGLNSSSGSLYAVRDGRQKLAEAKGSDPAATVALNWSRPGLTLGGALHHQTDITQGEDPSAGSAWLGELHADLRYKKFGLRAVAAEWLLEGDGPESAGADRQRGWYAEPSYRLTEAVGLFTRYSQWNNQAGSSAFDSEKRQMDAGVNWWPVAQVVVKADYQWQDNENDKNQNGFNAGLGYEF